MSTASLSESPPGIVINASMTLAWVFERQQPCDSERANRLLAACDEVPWWIPGLWHLELANALLVAELSKSSTTTDPCHEPSAPHHPR